MRLWAIVTGLLLAAVLAAVLAAAVAVRNLDAYLNRNNAWLAERAEQAVGRKITFAEVGVSLWPGLGIQIRDLEVADDPAFSSSATRRPLG